MMQKLTALKAMRYAGRAMQPGDVFEAASRDARLLKAVRRAADHVEVAPPAKVAAPPIAAAPQPASDSLDDEGRRVPRYRRRDMTAEEVE